MQNSALDDVWNDDDLAVARGSLLSAVSSPSAPAETIDAAQILRDRPDVYAAFYREFYGPNNDRNSDAWTDRIGGDTPEDYARYWYKTYGVSEGYAQDGGGSGGLGAPAEVDGFQGRTTIDGIPLAKILADRPDVFQAFFTEYYGPNNDRHSDAWTKRVGGDTVEDYANYWYNAYGKVGGYVPSSPAPAAPNDPAPTDPPPVDVTPPTDDLPPELPPAGGGDPAAPADPFVYSDPGAPMLPIVPGQSLFDDADPFGV